MQKLVVHVAAFVFASSEVDQQRQLLPTYYHYDKSRLAVVAWLMVFLSWTASIVGWWSLTIPCAFVINPHL